MELILPANFDARLLQGLKGLPVSHLYGALSQDPGMRPQSWLPPVDERKLLEQVEEARSRGLGFIYILNPSCWGNRELTAAGQRWLVDRLGWLQDIGVEAVVVANPYMVELIKQRFPGMQVHVSVVANIDSLNKALFYEKLGADLIHVATSANRDLPFLQALVKAVACEVSIVVNEGCLLHCPLREYHANLVSHSAESIREGYHIDYCLLKCAIIKAGEPVELIKSPWLPPQALPLYEKLGIRKFKLAGRDKKTDWILRAARAYAERAYSGDLIQLIAGFDELPPFGPLPLSIDSKRLDGFVSELWEKDCRLCAGCTYCHEVAARAVKIDALRQEEYIRRIEAVLRSLTAGTYRAPQGALRAGWPCSGL